MHTGIRPKSNNIKIKKFGDEYEVNFNETSWFYLDFVGMQELRDKISEALDPPKKDDNLLREKDDYIDEIGNGKSFEKEQIEMGDEDDGEI